jgi:hypothetical protein
MKVGSIGTVASIGIQAAVFGIQNASLGIQAVFIGKQASSIGIKVNSIDKQAASISIQASSIGIQTASIGMPASSICMTPLFTYNQAASIYWQVLYIRLSYCLIWRYISYNWSCNSSLWHSASVRNAVSHRGKMVNSSTV